VTAMSPIRFKKHIRLQAARLLLANRPNDVISVGHRVGYDSPSQCPPSLDAVRMRGGAGPAAAVLP
jgi:AraC-like DNA-binding protein